MQPNSFGASGKRSRKTRWLVIALIIILVVAINATWGWLYSSKRTDFHNQLNDAQQTANDQKSKNEQLANELADSKARLADKDKQKPESEQTSSEYREIPELGIKYKLTDETKNLTYSYLVHHSKNGDVEQIAFSTVALTKLGAQESLDKSASDNPCVASAFPTGALERYSPGQTYELQNKPIEQVDGTTKIGDYYFLYRAPQAVCGQSKDDSIQQQAIAAVKEAVSSLQPID